MEKRLIHLMDFHNPSCKKSEISIKRAKFIASHLVWETNIILALNSVPTKTGIYAEFSTILIIIFESPKVKLIELNAPVQT